MQRFAETNNEIYLLCDIFIDCRQQVEKMCDPLTLLPCSKNWVAATLQKLNPLNIYAMYLTYFWQRLKYFES